MKSTHSVLVHQDSPGKNVEKVWMSREGERDRGGRESDKATETITQYGALYSVLFAWYS
jgi:hypothetical protein